MLEIILGGGSMVNDSAIPGFVRFGIGSVFDSGSWCDSVAGGVFDFGYSSAFEKGSLYSLRHYLTF